MSHGVIVHVTWVQSTGLPSLICYGRGHAAGDSNETIPLRWLYLTVFFPVKYDRQSGNIYPRARCPRIWQQSSTTPTTLGQRRNKNYHEAAQPTYQSRRGPVFFLVRNNCDIHRNVLIYLRRTSFVMRLPKLPYYETI